MRMVGIVCFVFSLPALAHAESGEAAPKKPLSITLEGPATVPLSVSVKPAPAAKASTLWFDIYQDGKPLKRVTVPAGKSGTVNVAVPVGKHAYEFRAEDPNLATASFTWTAGIPSTNVASSPSFVEVPTAGMSDPLARAYAPAVGELIASDLGQLLAATRPLGADVQTMAHYTKDARRLVVSILGPTQTADEAKAAIEYLRKQAWEPMEYRTELLFGIKLQDADVTIRYLDKGKDYKELIRRENGKYVIP